MHARLVGFIVFLVCVAPSLRAQRLVSSIDLAGTGVWYADTLRSTGTSVSPALRIDWPRGTLGIAANFARLDNGGSSAQAALTPSIFSPSVGRLTGELAGALGGSTHHDGTRTGQMLGVGRVYLSVDEAGAWGGAGAGRTWDGVIWRNIRQGEIGAWSERDQLTMLAAVTPVVVADTIHYTDVQAAVKTHGAIELGFAAGVRSGSVGPAVGGSSRVWGNVSAVDWVMPQVAIVGNVGSYPVDLTQGYPGGRFVSIALRVASRDARAAEHRAVAARDADAPAHEQTLMTSATAFELRTPTRGAVLRELRVYAPAAKSVEINADFTQWQAIRLTRGPDGWWTATRPIAAGTYQMNIRINGGAWLPPPGLLATRDEFGGSTGILRIE